MNCAGQWAKQVGALAGVNVPLHSAEHFYVVTDPIDGVHTDLPVLRDPDGYTYFKEEVGGLVVGGFEPEAKPWVAPDQIPYPFEFQLLDEDWDHFSVLMESALLRIPALQTTGIGSSTTDRRASRPDNQFILGEAPEVRNFFVAAGLNSVGIATAGRRRPGAGGVDRRRRAVDGPHRRGHQAVRRLQREQPVAARPGGGGARPALRDPLAEPRDADGPALPPLAGLPPAARGERELRQQDGLGTGQLLRACPGESAEIEYSWGRQNWLPWSAAEQRAARAAVAVFDQTSFSKFLLTGPDAESVLQWLCTADAGGAAGQDRLHRHAQRARHLRVRRHAHPAVRARSTSS